MAIASTGASARWARMVQRWLQGVCDGRQGMGYFHLTVSCSVAPLKRHFV